MANQFKEGPGEGGMDPGPLAELLKQNQGNFQELLEELGGELGGNGGINRGPGHAPLLYGNNTSEEGSEFKEQKDAKISGQVCSESSFEDAVNGALSEINFQQYQKIVLAQKLVLKNSFNWLKPLRSFSCFPSSKICFLSIVISSVCFNSTIVFVLFWHSLSKRCQTNLR